MLIVEDLISTAGSSVRVIDAIRKLEGVVKDEVAIYTHNLKEAEKNLENANVKLHYLTDTKTAAEVAKNEGFLKREQLAAILYWVKDPKSWAKKMGYE